MTNKEAYELGKSAGADAVAYCEVLFVDQRNAGCDCAVTAGSCCEDCLTAAAFDAEQNARQYAGHYSEGLSEERHWDRYDAGVGVGIRAGLRTRLEA